MHDLSYQNQTQTDEMLTYLPKQLAFRAILIYVLTLTGVSVLFFNHIMSPLYLVMGVLWVVGFFLLANRFTIQWEVRSPMNFIWLTFWVAFVLRVVWVLFSYFYYLGSTGIPFEFQTADALAYHLDAEWMASVDIEKAFEYLFKTNMAFSDTGYYLMLMFLYRLVGPNIFVVRLIKCILSAWTCVLVYRLSSRTFGEPTGRITAVFCCLMPNLIYYCGLHLKETEMLFLVFAALERIDYIVRDRRMNLWNFVLAAILVFLLFMFRTVVAIAVLFATVTMILFSPSEILERWRKTVLVIWMGVTIAVFIGGTISLEVQSTWENRANNQMQKRAQQTIQGNQWAKYATGTVMAPMMFVIPFPTMVDVDKQYNQQMLNGGNYIRNFLGVFVLIAVFNMLFLERDWKKYLLVGTYAISYLGVVSLSGFANSERFVLPGLPILLMFAAYGLTLLDEFYYRWVRVWYWIVPAMSLGWAYFKLGSRGIV